MTPAELAEHPKVAEALYALPERLFAIFGWSEQDKHEAGRDVTDAVVETAPHIVSSILTVYRESLVTEDAFIAAEAEAIAVFTKSGPVNGDGIDKAVEMLNRLYYAVEAAAPILLAPHLQRVDALTAENAKLREAIEYAWHHLSQGTDEVAYDILTNARALVDARPEEKR